MNTQTGLTELKGIGEKTAGLFARLQITDVGSLLDHYPRDYDKMEPLAAVSDMVPGRIYAVRAAIIGSPATRKIRSLTITTVQAGDVTGLFRVTFFGMPYLKNILKPGSIHVFRGLCQSTGKGKIRTADGDYPMLAAGFVKMEQPSVYSVAEYEALQGTLQPRYPLTAGLTNHIVKKTIKSALECLDDRELAEFLPESVLAKFHLMPYRDAVFGIHRPETMEEVYAARNRLAFNEFLAFFMGLGRLKEENKIRMVSDPLKKVPDTDSLIEQLPYSLTGAQRRVWKEIEADLTSRKAMNRLVQGDVGSGKTILAFLALLLCAANGRQGCLMAPTEVLAAQHYEAMIRLAEQQGLCLKPVLLTGSCTAAEKRNIYRRIAEGEVNVIIGTHALIQEKVQYHKLSLVVTDEQHRFGVRQREKLAEKGENTHVLVMSATPIPRTLAIVLYGDLNVSVLDEMPVGRLPIRNCVVDASWRPKAFDFIRKQVEQGHQAYCICPMVEEGELDGLENVEDYTQKLRMSLPSTFRIRALHGRMKPAEKNSIMEAFGRKEIDVLVSTTVIEVGINVPNATVMLVENAERFGLAQLHQLRGRVGRGDAQSYCIFISATDNEQIMKRLRILTESNDGFFIANEDLKLRGPGDLFGIRQSGRLDFKIGDIYQDSDLLLKASSLAERILSDDPKCEKEAWQPLYSWESQVRNSIDFRSI